MNDLSPAILARIYDQKMEKLSLEEDMVLPYYDGLSLVNIPATVCRLLDVPDFGSPPIDETILSSFSKSYKKVVLLMVDALGTHLFDQMRQPERDLLWGKYIDRAVYSPITSVCPSTTASALTTLWTGETPAAHGIIGYEMWTKEFGMVMNNINHSAASSFGDTGGLMRSGFDPHTFMNKPLLGTHLVQHDVIPTTYIHSSIAHSGLSMMQMDDVKIQTYVDEADLCVSLAQHLNSRQGAREYIYVYYSDVDTLMHRYNAQDERVSLQFEAFSSLFERAFLNKLSFTAAKETLLILIADHGSKATPHYSKYELNRHPDLTDCLVMQPTCENRLAFLYIKPGKVQTVRDYFKRIWPEDFVLIDSDIALNSGLFGEGPFHPQARERMGDLIVVAKGDAYLWWVPKPNHMAGRHGGLSDEEMLVPFYALPLSEIV